MNHIKRLFLISLASILLCNFQCDEEECPNQTTNRSSIPINVSPQQKIYYLGDTIWVSANFATVLELTNSNETFEVAGGSGFFNTKIIYLDEGSTIRRGFSDFLIVNAIGELKQDSSSHENNLQYEGYTYFFCDTDFCDFRIGLIPQKTGNYCIHFGLGRVDLPDAGECSSYNRLEDNFFAVSSFNRELYQEFGLPDYVGLPRASGEGVLNVAASDDTYNFRVE